MYDPKVGRWFGVDPLSEKRYGLSSYNYCWNNPVLLVDPDGCLDTHYVDEDYNTILQTNDGSDDVVMVPADRMSFFLSVFRSSRWDEDRLNSLGWNQFWKDQFGLADRQLSIAELDVLKGFSTKWSRNNAVSYLLNPTFGNALRMGVSEALSSWTNPELLVAGLGVGVIGWHGGVKTKPGMNSNVFHVTPDGVVLRKGDIIPSVFIESRYRAGSYGVYMQGRYVEKIRVDKATSAGQKGPNYSHFHINQSSKHKTNGWPYKL